MSANELNEAADWSSIELCPYCGAGNPVNRVECIRCKKPLPPINKSPHKSPHESPHERPFTPEEIAMILDTVCFQFPNSEKLSFMRKWWRLLYRRLLKPLRILGLVILFLIVIVEHVITRIAELMEPLLVALFALLRRGVNYLIKTHDLREAKRDERNAERARRKKQIPLNRDIEKIASMIKKQIDLQKPLENILPKIRVKNYEAIAKAISSVDSLKETEKGCLFNNLDPDSISHILNYFKDSEKINILQKIEQRKREDVLMRFHLYKRQNLK